MEEHLKEIQKKQKTAATRASISLILSMLTMAIWGWTPLKNLIPAFAVLMVFAVFGIVSIGLTVLSLYRGIQARAQKAIIEDK